MGSSNSARSMSQMFVQKAVDSMNMASAQLNSPVTAANPDTPDIPPVVDWPMTFAVAGMQVQSAQVFATLALATKDTVPSGLIVPGLK